jgi:2',5'-phosphodiesterase
MRRNSVVFLCLVSVVASLQFRGSSTSSTSLAMSSTFAAAATGAGATSLAAKLRVVSYNVLSSHLSSPSFYTTLEPEHLDPVNRLTKVLSKLEGEMKVAAQSNRLAVFCLQEVSYDWAGELHTFFAKNNYHVVTGLYGKRFNGYMGILTAYPVAELENVSVDICRLSDTVDVWPPDEPPESSFRKWMRALVTPALNLLGLYKEAPESHWSIAQRRANVMVTTVLKDKQSKQSFAIGNYHMPCCYYAPMVMVLHCDMCVSHLQRIAATKAHGEASPASAMTSLPYILAGDFNIKPKSAPYELLTTGLIDKGDPVNYPSAPVHAPDFSWKPTLMRPVRSAYASCKGGEPDFTNYSRAKEEAPFIDTLDYIFISEGVTVQEVLDLPIRDTDGGNGPFPNEIEPSDHILIAANVDVVAPAIA